MGDTPRVPPKPGSTPLPNSGSLYKDGSTVGVTGGGTTASGFTTGGATGSTCATGGGTSASPDC